MEKTTLNIYFENGDLDNAALLLGALRADGFDARFGPSSPIQEDFCIVILSKSTSKEALLDALPWLGSQFELSSFRGFRLMPVLVYRESEGLDNVWESGVGEIYEEIFSGEFKPFGFDLDSPSPLKEFPRILEEYL